MQLPAALAAGVWHHVAFVIADGRIRGYLDGVQGLDATIGATNAYTGDLQIGRATGTVNGTSWHTAWNHGAFDMDDLRITRAARYSSAFTPGEAPAVPAI